MKIKEMNVPIEEHDQRYDEDDDDDEGSYIEISLEAKQRCEKVENVFQFRLSFSTMLPRNSDSGGSFRRKLLMSAESVETTSSESYTFSYDSSSVSSSSSSSSAVLGRSNARRNLDWMAFTKPEEVKLSETQNQWRKAVQFLAVRRLVKLLILNLRSSADNTESNRDDADKRKRSKASEVINSGLMKLIIKFRTMKEKSKNTLTIASNHISGSRQAIRKTDKLSYTCYESPVIEPISATERKRDKRLKLSEVSINSIKGMIDSLTVSCPASIKSSPIHRNYCGTESTVKSYSRENSIQAAIAHCKMSFDQTATDFSQ